jgi:amino acid transporter
MAVQQDRVPVRDKSGIDLEQFGYRQEFDRTLRRFASFAIAFSFISITTGIFTTYGSVLISTGPVGIWTWPLVIVGQTAVALVFGLLAARMPLAGYSYQWMSRLANPHIGWLVGWFVFAFLIVDTVAVDYALASTVLPALFSYTATVDNTWAVTALIVALQGGLIMLSTLWSTRVNNVAVGTEVVGIVGLTLLILIVGAAAGKLTGSHIFSHGVVGNPANFYGFGSLGHDTPFIFAFLLGAFTIVGFEAAGNLAEETSKPERVVPRAMWLSVVLSGVIGFGFLLAISAATKNIPALTASSTPVADVVKFVLGSVVGRIFLAFVTFSIFACGLVIFITASRVTWAMARDERFPGWQVLKKVNSVFRTPLVATAVVGILIEAVLAVFAHRTHALFSLFSAATLMPAIIYFVTVVLFMFARNKLPRKEGGFSIGRWEWPVVAVAVVWLIFELLIFRDSSFKLPWEYTGVMFGVGLVYYAYMLIRGKSLTMPEQTVEPEEMAPRSTEKEGQRVA